jgi:hypothetical protein
LSPKPAQGRQAIGVAIAILLTVVPAAAAQGPPSSPLPATGATAPQAEPAAALKPSAIVPPASGKAQETTIVTSGGVSAGAGRSFDGFSALRHVVLEAIAGARQRIWLTTDFLSDGEIVTALYLAQYRKLDVKVLLGRWKAQHTLSRLNYLKQQKVPVFLRPDTFKPGQPTAVLADDALLYVDGELDSQARARRFTLTQATLEATQRFAGDFAAAANLEVPAVSRAMPMVGRAHTGGRTHDGGGVSSYNKYTSDGAYRYDRKAEPRPDGVSAKLPKQTKLQERKKAPPLPPESSMP